MVLISIRVRLSSWKRRISTLLKINKICFLNAIKDNIVCALSYLGVSLLLTDETISRQAEFSYSSIPDVFDQGSDLVGFGNVVGCTAEKCGS